MFDTEILIILALGVSSAWLLIMAAMAGRMNQLEKSYRAQIRYDIKLAEIERLKGIRNSAVNPKP